MKQLAENELTKEELINVFKSAYMKVEDQDDKSFRVKCEDLGVRVSIDKERKHLRLSILYVLNKRMPLSTAEHIVNEINKDFIFIRFSVFELEEKTYINSDYYISFEEGLIPFHVVHMTKRLEKFTVEALRESFDSYL